MIRLKNNTGGWYSLKLQDSTGTKFDRTFVFPLPDTELTVPDDYAASIASDLYALAAYKSGTFLVVKGQEELDAYLKENGNEDHEIVEMKANIVPDAMLLAALKDGKLAKVKEYINSPNLDRLVQLAIDNIQSISKEKIGAIEEATGVSLTIDEE